MSKLFVHNNRFTVLENGYTAAIKEEIALIALER